MKKILIDGRLLSDIPTGISRYSRELIRMYQNQFGYENVLVLVNRPLEEMNFKYRITKFKPFNLFHFFLFKRYVLDKVDFDIYHSLFYANSYFKKKDKFYIITVHDLMYRILEDFFSANVIVNKLGIIYYNFLIKKSIKNADKIISVSETTKKDTSRFFKKDSVFIPEGINLTTTEEKEVKCLKNKKYFLYVGNARRHKNLDFLYNAFKKLNEDKYLVIVGNDKKWKDQNERVISLGKINDAELKWVYKNALAFIFPSQYEGFGLPILEALHNGCLVISSNAGALKDFGIKSIKYFNPNVQEELHAHLKNVGNYKNDECEIKKLLKFYSWENTEKHMKKFWHELEGEVNQ
jgi:glycosyltransferase involved in cell wall biosynthesis